ncbi:MAG: hypothetical protein LC754_02570 [Acidobacteria bacterium]|nr:hypothetical protein [Acidobacteriota bacterium]
MSNMHQSNKLTASERMTATLLRYAPWLAFFLVALPLPVYFLLRYFTATEEQGVYMLLTLTTLAAGSIAGLIVALFFLFYRMRWLKRLRDRLASDGVTADELSWFTSELTTAERRTLKQMERHNLLLADAYRETLAARITASRVLVSSRRESVAVESRLRRASQFQSQGSVSLLKELQDDRARLERITRQASEQRAEIETRLQLIEALASRDASEAETERALLRLGTAREYEPLGLTATQLEREAHARDEEDPRQPDSPPNS